MIKLLIVEDDVLLGDAYRGKFSGKYDVRIVINGKSGVDVSRTWKPDFIILDIYLPGKLDGIDVLRELKKDPETSKIPVLVVTNLPDAIRKVKAMGAEECYMKTDVSLDFIEKKLDELAANKDGLV